jgi:hypothetical protein
MPTPEDPNSEQPAEDDGQFEYTEEEWTVAAAHRPLRDVEGEQLLLLQRHGIWADQERKLFQAQLEAGERVQPDRLAAEVSRTLFLWYALVWSVIEGFAERGIVLQGRLAEDIEAVSDGLRQFRNAVFHISRRRYFDTRLFRLMRDDPDLPYRVARIHYGFGRLLDEELKERNA